MFASCSLTAGIGSSSSSQTAVTLDGNEVSIDDGQTMILCYVIQS